MLIIHNHLVTLSANSSAVITSCSVLFLVNLFLKYSTSLGHNPQMAPRVRKNPKSVSKSTRGGDVIV